MAGRPVNWTAFIVSVVLALIFAEYSDVAPWLAEKIVCRSARTIYSDNAERAEIRAEEWAAVIRDRPGKLLKLLTASGYGISAIVAAARQRDRFRSYRRMLFEYVLFGGCSEILLLWALLRPRLGKVGGLVAAAAVIFAPLIVLPGALSEAVNALDGNSSATPPLWWMLLVMAASVPISPLIMKWYMRGIIAHVALIILRRSRVERKRLIKEARVLARQHFMQEWPRGLYPSKWK